MKPRAIGQKPISKPAVNMAPNFGKPVGRKTPPNVQKIEAGDGIYIQTKHKQTTLRSSRDQQNFPSIPSHANNTKNVNEGIPNINPIVAQTIFQRNQSKFLYIQQLCNNLSYATFFSRYFSRFSRSINRRWYQKLGDSRIWIQFRWDFYNF